MLGVGEKFPSFSVTATVSTEEDQEFAIITHGSYPQRWKVYFFWPKDFCPRALSELVSFGELYPELLQLHTQGLGGSVESEYAHLAWRKEESALHDFPYPMLADTTRELCGELGILDEAQGTAQRAALIVDPHDVIRFVYVTDFDVSRDPGEILRVLAHLERP